MLSHFYPIPERYGQTDKQMEMDRIAISVPHVSMLMRDKNIEQQLKYKTTASLAASSAVQ